MTKFLSKVTLLFIFLAVSILYSSCTKLGEKTGSENKEITLTPPPELSGNGQGFGGGDGPLSEARAFYIKAVSLIRDNYEITRFAENGACLFQNLAVAEPILCNYLIGLTPDQKQFLKAYVKDNADKIVKLNTGDTKIRFEFTTEDIKLDAATQNQRDLSAKTALSDEGSVLFQEAKVLALSPYRQIALIAHEIGHKTYVNLVPSHFVSDTDSVGPFPNGITFLDTLGAAISLYLIESTGKTLVTVPDKYSACYKEVTQYGLLHSAPYYQTPTLNVQLGAKNASAEKFISTLNSQSSFTVTTWVRVFDQLPAAAISRVQDGEAILSNSNNNDDQESRLAFGLYWLKNGNFGAFAGGASNQVIDSGAFLTPNIFHHLAFKREITTNAALIKLFVDGSLKVSTSAYYRDEDGVESILSLSSVFTALSGREMNIGRPAFTSEFNSCSTGVTGNAEDISQMCMTYFEGHIAEISFYKSALSDSEIKALSDCAPVK